MTRRTGSADLPLHGGRVPAWLGQRMAKLGAVVCQAIVHHYGRDELLAGAGWSVRKVYTGAPQPMRLWACERG